MTLYSIAVSAQLTSQCILYGYDLLSKLNNDKEFIPNLFGVYDDGNKHRIFLFVVVPIPKLLELVLGNGGTVCIVNFSQKRYSYFAMNLQQ